MRIADAAKEYHVSEQAIRNRLKRAGYNLNELREPGSGQLTEAGEMAIRSLYEGKRKTAGRPPSTPAPAETPEKVKDTGSTLATVKKENDALRIRAATAEAQAAERAVTIQILQDQIREKDEIIATLVKATAARAALPESAGSEPVQNRQKMKFMDRLRAWKEGKKHKI